MRSMFGRSRTTKSVICIAGLITAIYIFEAGADVSCSSAEQCETVCAQHQDQLNQNAMAGQVYVCQMTFQNEVVVMGGEEDDTEEPTSNPQSHTSFLCTCVSYMNTGNPDEVGAGSDRPGKDNPVHIIPPPPGDGYYVQGNPYSRCVARATAQKEKCDERAAEILSRCAPRKCEARGA
ncbi:MAG: hypothetical protein U9Q81_12295 [Pseudomonadota bacterium]|nr:hypothetical protein [Pseudomonadota bacterium]